MQKLSDQVIEPDKDGRGLALELRKGQLIRIAGRQTVDFVAFNLDNLSERFDQARTRVNQMKLFLTTGDYLVSKDNTTMLTIVEDGWPWTHDLQKGLCSRKRDEMAVKDRRGGRLRRMELAKDVGGASAAGLLGEPDHSLGAVGYRQVGYPQRVQHLSEHAHRRRDRAHVFRPSPA